MEKHHVEAYITEEDVVKGIRKKKRNFDTSNP